MDRLWWVILGSLTLCGCSAFPDIARQPRYHNPFPQLSRVAVLPFYNQSADPTIDQDKVALAYYAELQAIPGFEVVPVGVTKMRMQAAGMTDPRTPEDYRQLAESLGVDAVVVGSVTEYTPYYPPRMGLSVRWYAANPNFYPIPPGYGLPWGTCEEEFIPTDLVFEAEFALAKEQLKTQTPAVERPVVGTGVSESSSRVVPAASEAAAPLQSERTAETDEELPLPGPAVPGVAEPRLHGGPEDIAGLWPDPRGLIPPPPSPQRPVGVPQYEPVITHTRLYHGQDPEFTERLANYYYFRDDARFGDWQAYLQRTDDFVRFCCHLHITEMLAARGGAGESRVVWRWPIRRYER